MPRIVRRVIGCWGSLSVLLCAVVPLSAQPAAPQVSAYQQPDEVVALEAVLAELNLDEARATPGDYIELSRSLAEPCDQLRWLLLQARMLQAQPATRASAAQLAALALERAAALRTLALLGDCADLPPLVQDLAKPTSPKDITDPAALAALLAQADKDNDLRKQLSELAPAEKFALLSRGAVPTLLVRSPESWYRPHLVVGELAKKPELPPAWELLKSRQDLGTAYGAWQKQGTGGLSVSDPSQGIAAAFQIAAALLDRALGSDQQDLAGLKQPIPYEETAAAWSAIAQACEGASLRTWATLAHLLAAGAEPAAQRSAALSAAQTAWQGVRTVDANLWPAVDQAANGWLARFQSQAPERLAQPKLLPLAADFRAASRAQRRTGEDQIRGLWSAGTPDADLLFQSIQRAKAADVGAQVEPFTIDKLCAEFGTAQLVYLFVEMIELHPTAAGRSSTWCGVAVFRTRYAGQQKGTKTEDAWSAKLIDEKPDPVAVLRAALAEPGPPVMEGGGIRRDARIIIALDGPPPLNWFDFEKQELLAALKVEDWTSDQGWLVYLPSATALASDQWSLDQTLRAWHRAAQRTGSEIGLPSASKLTVGNAGSLLEQRSEMSVYVVKVGEGEAPTDKTLKNFLTTKKGAKYNALPLWLHNPPPGRP